MGQTGTGISKLIEWNCVASNPSDKEIFSFDSEIKWDASVKDKEPIQLDDLYYIFTQHTGKLVCIDKYGNIALMDYDKSKGVVSNAKLVGQCYAPEKNGAAMSRNGRYLYFIDHDDGSVLQRHDFING